MKKTHCRAYCHNIETKLLQLSSCTIHFLCEVVFITFTQRTYFIKPTYINV